MTTKAVRNFYTHATETVQNNAIEALAQCEEKMYQHLKSCEIILANIENTYGEGSCDADRLLGCLARLRKDIQFQTVGSVGPLAFLSEDNSLKQEK